MFRIIPNLPALPSFKIRGFNGRFLFVSSLVVVFYAWCIRLVLLECKEDIFMSSKCHPFMRFSAWKKCAGEEFGKITQAERNKLNILGPFYSKKCFSCAFTDSKYILLMTSIAISFQKFLGAFIYLLVVKRFWRGYVTPFLAFASFVGISAMKWYCLENTMSLTSYNLPNHVEFRIIENMILALICIIGAVFISRSHKSEETYINLIAEEVKSICDAST